MKLIEEKTVNFLRALLNDFIKAVATEVVFKISFFISEKAFGSGLVLSLIQGIDSFVLIIIILYLVWEILVRLWNERSVIDGKRCFLFA